MEEVKIASINEKFIGVWDSVANILRIGLYPHCCCETPTETTTETTTEFTTETTTEFTTETTTEFTTETTTEFTTETTTEFTTETPTEFTTETTTESNTETPLDNQQVINPFFFVNAYSSEENNSEISGWIPVGDGTCVYTTNPPPGIPVYSSDGDCKCGFYGDCSEAT